MDYDDNDFQSQNFQLVGEDTREDSSKFPSALRSFALPGFDLDDHLQIHLRFDSLIEPGNLLGITGQEENNWIESFSAGGDTVGFSSNAAESRSISRNNNAWSEATSSESVEMLLKSVGEDGVMEIKTISEQPDGNNTLNNLVSTTTNITTIVPIDTEMEGQGNADTTLAEKSHNHSPEIREDIVNIPSTDDQTFIGGKHLLSESSADLVGCQSNDAHTKDMVICLSATSVEEQAHQEELSIDQKSLERASEENSLNHPHLSCHASDDSLISNLGKTRSDATHLDGTSSATSIDVVGTDDSSALKSTDNVSAEHNKVLPHEIGSMLPSCQRVENQSLHSAVQIDKCSAVGNSTNSSVNPSVSEQQKLEDSSRLLVEGFNELTHSKKTDGLLEIIDQAKLGSSAGVVGTETRDEPFGDANYLKIDSEKSIKKDNVDFEFSTAAEVAKADGVDFHKESPVSVQVVDMAMREESPIMSGKADEMQAFEPMANENPSDQLSSAKELMVKNPDILPSDDIINQPEKLHHEQTVGPTETDKVGLHVSSLPDEGPVGSGHENTVVAESCHMNLSSLKTIITKKNQSVSSCSVNVVSSSSLITGMGQDCMVHVKDTSTATAHVESPKMDTIQKDPGKTDSNLKSTTLVPSGESEHTNPLLSDEACMSDERALDNQLASSGLPPSKLILSDKSSQSFSGACVPVLERCDNPQTVSLHVGASNSESDVVGTSGQLTSTKTASSSKMHNSISANVAVKPQNKVPFSTDKPNTLEYAIGEKGHPTAATEMKRAEIDNLASSSYAGDAHRQKDRSLNVEIDESMSVETGNANLSERSCGSPRIVSLVQHSHDVRDAQGNKKGSVDHLQVTEDHCVSDIEKTSCINESIDGNAKERNPFPEEKGFTFEVGHLPERPEEMVTKGWGPFSSPQSSEAPQSPQMTSPKSGHDQRNSTEQSDISQVSQLVSHEKCTHDLGTKSADAEKTQPSAISSSARWKTKEKSVSKKVVEKRKSPSNTFAGSFGPINRHLQSEGARKDSFEGTKIKSSSPSPTVASNLPDLNSTTTTVLINQPFTDSQQVQLRAQIFVYGALIQGIPPDEACMVSAFGNVDGGRSKWEGVWRAVSEKYNNQKSPLAVSDALSRPVVKVPSHMQWSSSPLQSKVIGNPSPRTGNKGPATTIFSPVSLPSPIWSMSSHDNLQSNASKTSHMEHSPVLSTQHSYQSPHVWQYSSNGTHFLPQSPSPVPWVGPTNTSTLDTGSRSPILPISNAVQFTPHRDLSMTHGSNIQFQSPASSFHTTGNVSSLTEVPVVSGRKKHTTTDQKSRRRKRDSEPQTEVEPVTGVSKLSISSAHADISSITSSGSLASTIAPVISPTHFHVMGSGLTEPKIIFSEETCSKIEQAKLQAEDAAFFAAASVQHSEGIWKQLAIQKSSGVVSEVEEKLASAAVAVAAAAAVAKAASAAAKLAADSAMQAKLMADEAILSGKTSRAPQICESSDQYSLDNMSTVTPASILKCKERSNGSIIPAAREAARRRLEAASAATKRAENLDALVKAAELAAEAVSQAGAIVAMGDPLHPFSAILEGGPEGYQKAQHLKGEKIVTIDGTHKEKQSTFDQLSLNEQDVPETAGGEIVHSSVDLPRRSLENPTGIASPKILDHEDGKDQATADASENVIREGSLIEVMSDVKVPGGIWYSARVLKLEHSKAYICYNELLNDEGSDVIKEWIPLDFESDRAPRIRVSHPIAPKKYGPRKRPRAVVVTHSWDTGDRVDAWINEGWREGVIAEKCEGDLTKFIVRFPAGGGTSTVGSWDLRPSLVWSEGQWIQWSRSMNKLEHHEGRDTPVQKRRKITRTEAKINSEAEAPGKCIREEDNTNRIKRTGLQKEGSKVVFGIPKPGKKRKFMDVSNHCVVENRGKPSEPVKFSKYLIQQSSKVDARSKRSVVLKPRNSKPVKPRNVHTRSLTDKGNSSIPILSSSDGKGNGRGALTSSKPFSIHVDSRLENQNLPEVGLDASKRTAEGPVPVSHSHATPEVPFVDKSTFDVESEKGGHTNVMEDSATSEEKASSFSGKVTTEVTEPRRSNRRIQPTSRLLEGLQSSSVIAKIPSVSHDKGSKVSHRSVSSSSRGHVRS